MGDPDLRRGAMQQEYDRRDGAPNRPGFISANGIATQAGLASQPPRGKQKLTGRGAYS
jgi:hypothetical protein